MKAKRDSKRFGMVPAMVLLAVLGVLVASCSSSSDGSRDGQENVAADTQSGSGGDSGAQESAACSEVVGGYTGPSWVGTMACDSPANVICFGGSSDVSNSDEQLCEPGQSYFNALPANSTKWYNIGGGDPGTGAFSPDLLSAFNDTLTAGAFKGYDGIFYDVEVFSDGVTPEDFSNSFATAKKQGFEVMVSTSYTAPYNCQQVAGCDQTMYSNYPTQTDPIFEGILADSNVDVFSPQFYGDNNGGNPNFGPTSGSNIGFSTWVSKIPSSAKVIPTLKCQDGGSASSCEDSTLENQISQTQQWCKGEPGGGSSSFWCGNQFYVWYGH